MKTTRAFSRPEPRRAGNAFVISSMLLSLCVLSLVRARYSSSSPYAKQRVSPEVEIAMESIKMVTARSRKLALNGEGDGTLGKHAEESRAAAAAEQSQKPICVETSRRSDVCEAEGDVRVQGSSQTVFLPATLTSQEWKVKPYARKHDQFALSNVKEWTLKPFGDDDPPPSCTENHTVPAVVFSTAGFTGNLFHDFTDVLVPLFITASRFDGEVQFVVADSKAWWLSKFGAILGQLSKYEVIDADADADGGSVRCFPRVIAGLSFHKELGVDLSKPPDGARSMADFKAMLRRAYGLERKTAEPSGDSAWDLRRKPRLLIISRRGSRVLLNERGMADMAMSLGFDVRTAEPEIATDLGKFARLVNSADVMVGVHGAGLANLVFLPKGAVFVQVVPMGDLTWLARDTFGNPAPELELHYLEYLIQADESTLSDQYPKDHPVFTDPQSIHRKGWNELSRVYLENQNMKPHLGRLRLTLLEALKFLPHSHINSMAQ